MFRKSNLAVKPQYTSEPISRTQLRVVGGTAAGSLTVAANNAMAAVPADVTTAITTAATDVATVGAAVIVVMVGIKVWKWIQRAL